MRWPLSPQMTRRPHNGQAGDEETYNVFLQSRGFDPAQYAFKDFMTHLAAGTGSLEALQEVRDLQQGPKPLSGPGKVQADIDAGLLPQGTPLRTAQSQVTVNNGTPYPGLSKLGEGMTYLYDENGNLMRDEMGRPISAPIPGSKQDLERAAAERGSQETERQSRLKLGTSLQSIQLNIAEIENGGFPVTGAMGDARRTFAGRALTGDDALDFDNRTRQITDSAAFDEIQRMRDNSPTGGAVGQLTDAERVAIGNAVTALNSSTSAEEYLRAATAYRDLSLNLAYGEGQWQLDGQGNVVAASGQQGSTSTGGIYSNFSQFSSDPGIQSAADQNGVTLEEMWQIYEERQR